MPVQFEALEETIAAQREAALPQAASDEQEVNLLDVLTQLAYRKQLIAKVTGVAVAAGLALAFLLPVRYTSVTTIMPPQQSPSAASLVMNQLAGAGAGSLAALAGGGLGVKNPNDVYLGLLQSRPVADAMIQRFGLMQVYHEKNMTAARKKLADYTDINSEKNGFITVSVTDRDKKRAAEMANAYTDQLRSLTQTLAVTEASQRRLFYEKQLKQANEALVAAEVALQQVQQQSGLVQPDAQAKAMIEGLAGLRAQVTAKQVQVQALRSYSTDRNPDVQLAEKELSSLEAEETHLEQQNHAQGASGLGLENLPAAGQEYLRAEHELIYRQALYDMLMKQYDAARLDEAKDAAIIQVVSPAIEADLKSSPKRGMLLVLSAIVGFFCGCICAMISWWKELIHVDPVASRRIEGFIHALRTRTTAHA